MSIFHNTFHNMNYFNVQNIQEFHTVFIEMNTCKIRIYYIITINNKCSFFKYITNLDIL